MVLKGYKMALAICRVLNLPCRMCPGSSPFVGLWARGLLWGTWVSTLGRFISCLSVAAIKHHDQKQPKDERVYFSLGFQRDRAHYGGERMTWWWEQVIGWSYFLLHSGSRRRDWKQGQTVNPQDSLPVMCFLQQSSTT